MRSKTRRTVLHWLAITLAGTLGGCLGRGNSDDQQPSATDQPTATATASSTPTETPAPTETPTPTPIPPSALDSSVEVNFGDSQFLPSNGVEIDVREVGTPDSVKAYVSDDEGHVRWVEFFEDDAQFAIYRNVHGTMVWSMSADVEMESDGDGVGVDELGWEPGASPERTVELLATFDGEERLLERERGTV